MLSHLRHPRTTQDTLQALYIFRVTPMKLTWMLEHLNRPQAPPVVTETEIHMPAATHTRTLKRGLSLELSLAGMCCTAQGTDRNHDTELLSNSLNS